MCAMGGYEVSQWIYNHMEVIKGCGCLDTQAYHH